MSNKVLAKTHDEFLMECYDSYRRKHAGPCRMEDVAQWALDTELLPAPKISAVRLLTRKFKQAARRKRFQDPQGRTVRKVLAVKTEHVDSSGNMILEVVWDYLHEMSADDAFTAFSQRDENIEQQRRAASRDLQSFLENNPNAMGHEDQFQFAFMTDDPTSLIRETIEETAFVQNSDSGNSPDYLASEFSRQMATERPR